MSRSLLFSVLISAFILTLFAFVSRDYRSAASQAALTDPFVAASAAPLKWKQPDSTPAPSRVTVSALLCDRAGTVETNAQPAEGDEMNPMLASTSNSCPQVIQRTILPR